MIKLKQKTNTFITKKAIKKQQKKTYQNHHIDKQTHLKTNKQ